MEGRTIEKIGEGGQSVVFESKNQFNDDGLILKFHFRELSEIIDAILQKKDPKILSEQLSKIRDIFEKKDEVIFSELERVTDSNLIKEITDYYAGKTSDVDYLIELCKKYIESDRYLFSTYAQDIKEITEKYSKIETYFGQKNVAGIKTIILGKNNIEKIDFNQAFLVLNLIRESSKQEMISKGDWEIIKKYIIENDITIPIIVQEKFVPKGADYITDFSTPLPTEEEFEKILDADLLLNDFTNTKNELKAKLLDNKLFTLVDADANLKKSVAEFVEKAIIYSKETHDYIDIFGKDNVIFYKENGIYNYKLLDPALNFDHYSTDKNIKNNSLKEFLSRNKKEIRHYYLYLKTINDFAEKFKIKERIKIEDILGTRVVGVENELENFLV